MLAPATAFRNQSQFVSCVFLFLLSCVAAPIAFGFNPPNEKQGPLTVRIEAPTEVDEAGVVFRTTVHIENDGSETVSGNIRVHGIDGWKCLPNEDQPFEVAAGKTQSIEFQVTPSIESYAALYPLHAIATYDAQNTSYTAHPIQIIKLKKSRRPAVDTGAVWQPFAVVDNSSVALWQLPTTRAVVQVFDRPPVVQSTSRPSSDSPGRFSLNPNTDVTLQNVTRSAIAIHPPWANGDTGTGAIEFPLTLPDASKILLRFATAVQPDGTGDGVTFRVRAVAWDAVDGELGKVLFDRHSAAKDWEAAEVDLSSLAGRSIRLQLESHPGPRQNTAFDLSYWAEPTLVVGSPPSPRPFPPIADADNRDTGDNMLHFACGDYSVDILPGRRGLLDADFGFHDGTRQLWFRGFEIKVAGMQLDDPGAPITLDQVEREPCDNGIRVRHRFLSVRGPFDLIGQATVEDERLRVHWQLENMPADEPWKVTRIESVSPGRFDSSVRRVYAGHGNVIENPKAFQLNFDGHRLATSFVGLDFANELSLLQAVDVPPTKLVVNPERKVYAIHSSGATTFTFIPGTNVWELCKLHRLGNGQTAAPGVTKLAGRFVFDLWGGNYAETSQQLKRSFRYGLTDSMVVWHNWQHWGYDYRLPEIYPPNPQLGSEDALKGMIDMCREQGVLFALHDNYIDFYPDADGFSYPNVIAFADSSRPIEAWLNKGRGAQAYRYRADQVSHFLKPNLTQIKDNLAPTSYFIDVWSSAGPYDYWTADGRYFDNISTRQVWGEHFAWIRDLLGDNAPQISESGHDQLIGWLDGAQTNHLRVGKPLPGSESWALWDIDCDDAERTPWMDAVNHDRFILHGAGYSNRYQAGLGADMHGIYSDDYVTTEVMTGHPAMVSDPFHRDCVRKYWLTHDLMRSLAMRQMEGVQYVQDDLHRQQIRWSGGAEVFVNRGQKDWTVANVTLPKYGFVASIPTEEGTVRAGIYRRDGVIVEQSQSENAVYANARGSLGTLLRIRPRVTAMESATDSSQPGQIAFTVAWDAADPIPSPYKPFLHFVDSEGEIAFQGSPVGPPFAPNASGDLLLSAVARLPEASQAGDEFYLGVGLYEASAGRRLTLLGRDDGTRRFRLGRIRVLENRSIQWIPEPDAVDEFATRVNMQAKPVDFGWVVTAGSLKAERQRETVLLTPLPDEKAGTRYQIRSDRLPWPTPQPKRIVAIRESEEVLWDRPLADDGAFQHDEQAFAYRLEP